MPEPAPDGDLARERRRIVIRALAEDLSTAGDVTTAACVPMALEATADVVARADGVMAGIDVLGEVFTFLDAGVHVEARVRDGERVTQGQVVATVAGRVRSLLAGERAALNLMGHLSGVATETRRFVDAVAEATDADVAVRDTRKTMPGLRLLDKAAVVAGGGVNHRRGLDDALLVKDNHVLAAGGAGAAARRALDRAGGRPVQVEVSSTGQLDQVLDAGIDDILLDNFTPQQVRSAVAQVDGRARLEASGTITLDNVREYAVTGVDRIAIGRLTHSAPWLDLAMDIRHAAEVADEDVPFIPEALEEELVDAQVPDPPPSEDPVADVPAVTPDVADPPEEPLRPHDFWDDDARTDATAVPAGDAVTPQDTPRKRRLWRRR